MINEDKAVRKMQQWRNDWNVFAYDVLGARLDDEQQEILHSVQTNPLTSVASGVARGKDYVSAVAAVCFMYLTPRFDRSGHMTKNTKVFLTAPCYDSKTEILTEDGWKYIWQLTYEDKVAQRSEDGEIEFVHPEEIICQRYVGEMMGCQTKQVDFLTTPNHRHWCHVGKSKGYGIKRTYELYGKNVRFEKRTLWSGGKQQDKDWMEFLGFWFADGCATFDTKRRKYRIAVTQKKRHVIAYVDDLISRVQPLLKKTFHRYERQDGKVNWELYDKDLAKEFIPYGKQIDRAIPKWIKTSDIESMKAFLRGFMAGDGSIDKNGSRKMCTASWRLADDLHEMCVKVGWMANKKRYKRKNRIWRFDEQSGQRFSEYYYEVKLPRKRGRYPLVQRHHWYTEQYDGFVHCVTVPSGIVMVRRNGYNFWSGNSQRQVEGIMIPEVTRLWTKAGFLPGRVTATGIKTNYREWFLSGFKADDSNMEAWSGLHAANIMFVVTEASGMSQTVFDAIEGNLQGNSRLLIVFNPNVTTGYAAQSLASERFKHFRLNSLHAENVIKKQNIIPGQVDYRWVDDHVKAWCTVINNRADFNEEDGDFEWEGKMWRPNDLARVKILGMFPKVSEDVLVPFEWIDAANKRWKELKEEGFEPNRPLSLGVDVAGMGRDSSVLCKRYDFFVSEFVEHQSAGVADHMHVAGLVWNAMKSRKDKAYIDTIGEGAGVLSRLEEMNKSLEFEKRKNVFSCKFSEGANGLQDATGEYSFSNMRAYLFWRIRDWLNPRNGFGAALPPNERLAEELMNIHWAFQSNGSILIEAKDKIKQRIGRSPDLSDSLANSFYPYGDRGLSDEQILQRMRW